MIDTTDFSAAFKAKLAEVEAEFAEKVAEIEAARQAVEMAEDAAFRAAQRFGNFNLTILQAARGSIVMGTEGSDEHHLTLITKPLDDLLYEELQRKQAVDLVLTRARKLLTTLEWRLNDLKDAALQLHACINPKPLAAPRLEVVKRPERPAVDIDDIAMPPAVRGAA